MSSSVGKIKDKDYVHSGRKSFTVWLDWHEWLALRSDLFPETNEHDNIDFIRRRALARIAAWRARGDLPIAIDVTAQLLEIFMHDTPYGAAPGSMYRSHEELSLLYAATLIRCVNGLVDASQKGAYAMSVSSLALRIGIPLWIVDIRHESAHTKLPSLPTLRLASRTMLTWLENRYWQPQEEHLRLRVQRVSLMLNAKLGGSKETELLSSLIAVDPEAVGKMIIPLLIKGVQYNEYCSSGMQCFIFFQDKLIKLVPL